MVRKKKTNPGVVRQTELSAITRTTYCEILCQGIPFPILMKSMTHHTSQESLPTVADDVVCDPPLYGMGSGDQSRAYKSLPTHRLLESKVHLSFGLHYQAQSYVCIVLLLSGHKSFLLTMFLVFCEKGERCSFCVLCIIQNPKSMNMTLSTPLGLDTRSVGQTTDYVVRSGHYTQKRVV